MYLAFAVDKDSIEHLVYDLCVDQTLAKIVSCNTFSRQAIPMVWDFAEANPISRTRLAICCLEELVRYLGSKLRRLIALLVDGHSRFGVSKDAATQSTSDNKIVSTDPPYYDNIGYADLVGLLLRLAAPLVSSPSFPISSPRSPSLRPKNWSLLHIGMGTRRRRRPSSSTVWDR